MYRVIFACIRNAGRSQMAAAFFNQFADPKLGRAVSAGTKPADRVHPEVISAMREVNIDLSDAKPQLLTAELANNVNMLITMGCGEDCPYVPETQREDWPLDDPGGKDIVTVRLIRDEVRGRVLDLIARELAESDAATLENK